MDASRRTIVPQIAAARTTTKPENLKLERFEMKGAGSSRSKAHAEYRDNGGVGRVGNDGYGRLSATPGSRTAHAIRPSRAAE